MMFSASAKPSPVVVDALAARLQRNCSLPLFSVACQRLAVWSPDEARALFRDVVQRTENPQLRRILALAALSAGEQRGWVARLLSEFRENALTLKFLEE